VPGRIAVKQVGCPQAKRLSKGTINSFVVAGLDDGKGGVLSEGASSGMMAMTEQQIHCLST